jgi:type I restriction enzyme S subunit
MNAERLLAQFKRISDAPDAIARLRRFILDLAVRGKLVEQDPEDEPAEELLSCITKHKKASLLTARDESPFPFDLPTGWVHTTLRTLVESSGSGWSPKTLDTPREGNEWGILKVSAVSWDQFRPEANKQVLPGTQPRPQAIIRKGDFLISRANTAELVARAVIVESEPINLMMSDKIVRLELVEPCEPRYILINNNHSTFARSYYAGRATGVSPSMKNVARGVILDLPLPLPPLAEQHRIVAKVDELMALCDQLEAARQKREQGRERLLAATLQRLNQPAEDPASFRKDASFALQVLPSLTTTPAQIKQLRQTILNLAVRGKLVEQDPEDEPAEELLAGVAEEKVRKSSRESRIAGGLLPNDRNYVQPFSLQASWEWTTLEDYALDVSTGPFGSMLHQSDYIVGGVPVVNPSHMVGGRICSDPKVTVSPGMAEQLESYKLAAGDIVMARRGEVGRAALVTEEEEGWLCGTGSFIVRFIPEILRAYVLLFLSTDLARGYLISNAIGTTMTNLNHGILKKTPIPLPPLAEQHRIVAKVDELMALCDQLEQQLSQADQQRRRLLEAVLAEALGGRLPTGQEESHAAIA